MANHEIHSLAKFYLQAAIVAMEMTKTVIDFKCRITYCRNHNNLINWSQEKNILADFQDILCDKCCSGYFHLVEDKSYTGDQVVYRYTNQKCSYKKI